MKTTSESDTFDTGARPIGKPELTLHIEKININQTLRTLSVFIFFINEKFETFLQGMRKDM